MGNSSVAVEAVRVTLDHTTDVTGLEQAFRDGRLDPDLVVAVTGKTEGSIPGETSRVDADRAIRRFLSDRRAHGERGVTDIPMVFTSGGVGILTPQIVVYSRRPAEPAADGTPRLSVGTARSSVMQPEWMGTTRVVEENVVAMRAAMDDAGLSADEVEYLIGKAYHVARADLEAARAAGRPIVELTDHQLFKKTSGSAGLAAAVALDGLPVPAADEITERLDLYSDKASFSANPWEPVGGDGPHTQVIALGNRPGAGGTLRVGHAALQDALDATALQRALRRAGLDVGNEPLTPEQRAKVVAVYVKAGPAPAGTLRGRRQVTANPHYGNEFKAAVAGMISGMLQDNLVYISGSATHQGPAGGGTVAVVVDLG